MEIIAVVDIAATGLPRTLDVTADVRTIVLVAVCRSLEGGAGVRVQENLARLWKPGGRHRPVDVMSSSIETVVDSTRESVPASWFPVEPHTRANFDVLSAVAQSEPMLPVAFPTSTKATSRVATIANCTAAVDRSCSTGKEEPLENIIVWLVISRPMEAFATTAGNPWQERDAVDIGELEKFAPVKEWVETEFDSSGAEAVRDVAVEVKWEMLVVRESDPDGEGDARDKRSEREALLKSFVRESEPENDADTVGEVRHEKSESEELLQSPDRESVSEIVGDAPSEKNDWVTLLKSFVREVVEDDDPDGTSLTETVIGDSGYRGRHMFLESPPGRHWHSAGALVPLMLHVLLLMARGRKQSALELHDPHGPDEMAPAGNSPEPTEMAIPFTALHRSYIFPPVPIFTDDAAHIEHPEPQVHRLSKIEIVPGVELGLLNRIAFRMQLV